MNAVMVTGADGYLGRSIVAALLDHGTDDLILTVRAADEVELAAKTAARGWGSLDRVTVVAADLREPKPFAAVDAATVGAIVHTAAVTHFSVDADTARTVNTEGTAKVRDFAATCPGLNRFIALSTLYAVGAVSGDIDETPSAGEKFVNHYERSKWAAEQVLLEAGAPPVIIPRMPTIIADDDSGAVSQFNAFHNTFRLYYYGLLSILPGSRDTPLSLATADFAVNAIVRLLDSPAAPGIYHVSPDPADCLTLGTAIDLAYRTFREEQSFRKRRILEPVLCDRDSFTDLVEAATVLRGGPLAQAMDSITPFAEQLYLPKTFRNERLHAAWPHYRAPDPAALVTAVYTTLCRTRWGRKTLTRGTDVST
ncbi:MAG: SDR family oxidoreductase [Nocardia sp.]|nr:SDR family oxidoreductase [Nocardia sp.]